MSSLTITHTPAEGTLLDGSAKGDGVAEVLRESGARWFWWRGGAVWCIRGSRDRRADRARIERTATLLRAAGHEVAVQVDDAERRSVAEQEEDRAARAARRVEGLTTKAERETAASEATSNRAREMASHIPFGQPILVGHHSEGRDRRYRSRIAGLDDRSLEHHRTAKDATQRAQAAAANQRHRENGATTERRIERLEVERRGLLRRTEGAEGEYLERLGLLLQDVDEQLAHWRKHLAELVESGAYRVWTREDFKRGDRVRTSFGVHEVVRVNAKSLTIPWRIKEDSGHTETIPYDEVRGRYSAEEWAAAVERAAQRAAEQDGEKAG